MKKTLFLSACLLLTGGLYAQTPEAESPVFLLDGIDLSAVAGLKASPDKASDGELIPWMHPDTIVTAKASNVGACAKADEGGIYAKYVYTFDERGNMLAQEYLQYVSEDVWLPSIRIASSYNQWDLVDTTTNYYFYAKDGVFVPNARKISTYNKRAQAVSLLNQTWDNQTETWSSSSRYTYTYNKDNQLIATLQEEPDNMVMGGEAWKKVMKYAYGYDRKGRQIRLEMEFWTGAEWFPYRSVYQTYENDLLTEELGYFFNEISGVYGPTYRFNNFYNEQGDLTDHIIFYADSNGKWDTTGIETYFFDEQGRGTGSLTKLYSDTYGCLVNNVRETYFYNKDGVKDSVAHDEWDEGGEWFHTISLRYFYNGQGVRNGYIYYNVTSEHAATDKYESEFNEYGDGTHAQCFMLQDGDWVAADRNALEVHDRYGNEILRANNTPLHEITVHYASGTKTPAPEPDTTADDNIAIERLDLRLDAQVDVYPNPAVGTLYVDIAGEGAYEVTLSNMTGVVVAAFRMESGRKALDVSGCKGVYILRVAKAGAAAVHKIMIL